MENNFAAYAVSLPMMIAGVAGSVFPALPGVVLVWAGMLAFFLLDKNNELSVTFLVIQAVLTLSSYAADYLITVWGIKRFGGSKAAAAGAVIGMLAVFVIGPFGIILGPLAGAVAGELLAGNQYRQALKSGVGSFVGFLFTMIYRLAICGIMLTCFALEVIF